MDAIITAITTALTPAVFLDTVADLVPFLVVIIPVSLGLHFLRKMIKGASVGKARF